MNPIFCLHLLSKPSIAFFRIGFFRKRRLTLRGLLVGGGGIFLVALIAFKAAQSHPHKDSKKGSVLVGYVLLRRK